MSEAKNDTRRALAAAKAIVAERDLSDTGAIMVTLEHTVAGVLLSLYPDHKSAAAMLNEGLVQGVEQRIAMHQARARK
ncbi:MAG: GntR family transcriptional regulator [Pseudomonadota bacterium]